MGQCGPHKVYEYTTTTTTLLFARRLWTNDFHQAAHAGQLRIVGSRIGELDIHGYENTTSSPIE